MKGMVNKGASLVVRDLLRVNLQFFTTRISCEVGVWQLPNSGNKYY